MNSMCFNMEQIQRAAMYVLSEDLLPREPDRCQGYVKGVVRLVDALQTAADEAEERAKRSLRDDKEEESP